MSATSESTPATLHEAMSSISQTVPLSLSTELSPLSKAEKTHWHTTNNGIVVTCDTSQAVPVKEGYHPKVEINGTNYYRVILMLSTEQETAIIDLFREKQWLYMKLEYDRDFTQSCDTRNQNNTDEAKYSSRIISGSNELAVGKITLDDNMSPSNTNVRTNAEELEKERYMESTANGVKMGGYSNCDGALVESGNYSKVSDIVAFDGLLKGKGTGNDGKSKITENYIAQIDSISKVKRPTRNSKINFYCKDCEHTFRYHSTYEKHIKEDKCKHTCEFCGKVFLYKRTHDYKRHIKYHRKQKDHECKICGKRFIEKSKMLQHVDFHTNPKPNICEKCGKGFPTTKSLRLHKENMHTENRNMLQCSKCGKMYKNQAGLWYHMQAEHESDCNVSFSCSVCDKSFKVKRSLTLHKRVHKETKDLKCNQCDASFKYRSSLLIHQRRHGKAYKMFCKTCNKVFYERRKLKEHENIHTGFKPYQCSVCDYRCAFRCNLPKHMKIHSAASNT